MHVRINLNICLCVCAHARASVCGCKYIPGIRGGIYIHRQIMYVCLCVCVWCVCACVCVCVRVHVHVCSHDTDMQTTCKDVCTQILLYLKESFLIFESLAAATVALAGLGRCVFL